MNKELFKQKVYAKYEQYKNDKNNEFYNTYYFNTNLKNKYKFSKIAASVIISCVATVSVVYASITTYNNYYQKRTNTDFEKNPNYDYSQDMDYQNGIYHKKLISYKEYITYKQKWNNLVEMTANDFNNYFVIIIAVENTSMVGLTVSNITTDNDNLYIELFQDTSNANSENSVISIKIPRENNRNNIILKKVGYQPTNNTYEDLTKLPKDYLKEQAITDNCFVIENGKVISSDKQQLDKFIEKSKQNQKTFIRIVTYSYEKLSKGIIITDVEYKNNKYYICIDTTRLIDNTYDKIGVFYREGTEIIQTRRKDTNNINTYIKDQYNNQFPICYTY